VSTSQPASTRASLTAGWSTPGVTIFPKSEVCERGQIKVQWKVLIVLTHQQVCHRACLDEVASQCEGIKVLSSCISRHPAQTQADRSYKLTTNLTTPSSVAIAVAGSRTQWDGQPINHVAFCVHTICLAAILARTKHTKHIRAQPKALCSCTW
jgi:hypothetical protein